ncbi:hypothetical protein V6N11_066535 [Hibiscus sabdariffa]|uniref:Uncharacterized protein n=1 Tax=Hibiscus sabdariffa TaxID=183260 RepID=A0ABR1ZUD3_9ROSI
MSHRILSQDQSPVCCAWPWNHGVRLRGVRLARSLASLRGLLRGLALSAGCAHCLGVRSTPLGSSLKAASLFYKASISPRFPTSDASVPAPMATAASGSPSEGLPTKVASTDAPCPASDSVAASLAPTDRLVSSAPTSSVQTTAVTKDIPHDHMVHTDTFDLVEEVVEDAPLDLENSETIADRLAYEDVMYDPMVHNDTSNMMEEALEISSDCVLLADLAGVI